ncbi:MAG: Nramp family divalent metal transporter [Gammaproteobacteria bacterium]|nr:Nramp family divalent metal transporter [Gammaproteobacteria bacterium]
MSNWLGRLGPGMMLAAAAVGVSHLVQSTRAGADYGLTFFWLIILIVVIKYPAFRFAVDYASATGRSLVTGYARIGKIALAWLCVSFVIDMFIATSAVALVTAGLFISVFDLPFTGPQVAVAVMMLSALILLNGQYSKAERIVKYLVLAFSILAVVTTLLALPHLGSDGRALFAEITPSRGLAVFVIAVAGWMPVPLTGAVFQSIWVKERKAASGDSFDHAAALYDLKFGYGLSLLLALCFLVMGAAILFQTDREIAASAGAFAAQLISIFTTVLGGWIYPLIALTAIAVMWSTLITLMDAVPRFFGRLFCIITGHGIDGPTYYTRYLVAQVFGGAIILLFMMHNFGAFIDFATGTGFIAAPAIAYYNYRAVMSAEVSPEYRPDKLLTAWNWLSVIAMVMFATGFLWLRATG